MATCVNDVWSKEQLLQYKEDLDKIRALLVAEAENLRKKYHLSIAEVRRILQDTLANSV